MTARIKGWLATGRVSNLPTIWSNIFASALCSSTWSSHSFQSLPFWISIFSLSFLYLGGCFLGDVMDVNFDKKIKPYRPLATGLLSSKLALCLAIFFLILGTIAPLLCYRPGFQSYTFLSLLLLSIIIYSIWHKQSAPLGLITIGLCRFFLILFVGSLFSLSNLHLFFYAFTVGIYTIFFASVARTESNNNPVNKRSLLSLSMLILPFLSVNYSIAVILPLTLYLIWISLALFQLKQNNKGAFVSKCLAGFCLLDFCFAPTSQQTNCFYVFIALFLCSLILQKIIPAT